MGRRFMSSMAIFERVAHLSYHRAIQDAGLTGLRSVMIYHRFTITVENQVSVLTGNPHEAWNSEIVGIASRLPGPSRSGCHFSPFGPGIIPGIAWSWTKMMAGLFISKVGVQHQFNLLDGIRSPSQQTVHNAVLL